MIFQGDCGELEIFKRYLDVVLDNLLEMKLLNEEE